MPFDGQLAMMLMEWWCQGWRFIVVGSVPGVIRLVPCMRTSKSNVRMRHCSAANGKKYSVAKVPMGTWLFDGQTTFFLYRTRVVAHSHRLEGLKQR